MNEITEMLSKILPHVQGFIYPNEIELHWGLLIVFYPYITGLPSGPFDGACVFDCGALAAFLPFGASGTRF